MDLEKEITGDARAVGCSYRDATRKPIRFVGLTVHTLSPTGAKAAHEATKGGGRDQTPVAGLGDDAYWDNTFGLLSVLMGRYEITIGVTAAATDDPLGAAKALAPKLMARLP